MKRDAKVSTIIYDTSREFYECLEKIIDSSIQLQKAYAENASIETSIPKEYAEIIQSIGEEFIKSNNLQNQITLLVLKVLSNNLQN